MIHIELENDAFLNLSPLAVVNLPVRVYSNAR